MGKTTLLLSIHSEFATRIFAGTKTVELRRTRPRVVAGDHVLVYVSSPVKLLMGGFEVSGVTQATPSELWKQVKNTAGVSSEKFDNYFSDAIAAFGIHITNQWTLRQSIPLQTLREVIPGFSPPQVYRYLADEQVAMLKLISAKLRVAA